MVFLLKQEETPMFSQFPAVPRGPTAIKSTDDRFSRTAIATILVAFVSVLVVSFATVAIGLS
jgi:hypothetical protein